SIARRQGVGKVVSTSATIYPPGRELDRKSWRNSVAGGSAFEQVFEVAIVVKRIRLLDVLQNSVHLFLGLAIQFFELHSYARSGVHSGDVSLGIQIAILKRKN